jgi:formylglycine-generating enzyme required for sulfatase activity
MKRFLQHSLAWCVAFVGAVALLCYPADSPAPAAPDKAPAAKNDHKSYSETIPGTKVKFDMVAIPGGTFTMGSPGKEAHRSEDEGPQHKVAIRPFWMGKTEVTWDEYDQFWKTRKGAKKDPPPKPNKEADAVSRPTPPYADETFGHGREGHPVLCITHHAAMEYCRWLSAKTGKVYRLPTEAEWEYACRAGTTTAYSWGDDPKKAEDYAWFTDNSDDVTHVVGKKKPNPWGLYDMHGNVAEWCLDNYSKDFYGKFKGDKPILSPVLLPTATRFSHVARGGSWTDPVDNLRSAARRASDKTWIQRDPQRPQSIWWLTDADFVGFRIIRPVEEQENLKGLKSKVTRESK